MRKLGPYRAKRDFSKTAEPAGSDPGESHGRFCVQKHDATRLHYDLRLEIDGVLKSWAMPKGPSLDPSNKRLAVQVEDHPIEYGSFEGTIPKGEYGGGSVMLWDHGTFTCDTDPDAELAKGEMKVIFHGERMKGKWALIRMKPKDGETQIPWLFLKEKDAAVRTDGEDLPEQFTTSVTTGRTMDEIARGASAQATTAMPKEMRPQLATLAEHPPQGEDWIHEIKFDGYRILAFLKDGKVRLMSRNGVDYTKDFRSIARSVEAIPLREAILDGEVVVLNEKGISDFAALQSFIEGTPAKLSYFVFDMPFVEGHDLTNRPLLERKTLLKEVLNDVEGVMFSDHILGHGPVVFRQAAEQGLEGIVSKRVDAKYRQARTRDWVKVKCIKRQEFVVGGYTEPGGSRTGFGSLAVGTYQDGKLIFAGRVGSGFDEKKLKSTFDRLRERDGSPFEPGMSKEEMKGMHYVEPELVCEVEFSNWTPDGRLRHPVFKGFRDDKLASEVVMEHAAEEVVRVTNPDRVIYPKDGVTKLQLAEYLVAVSPWLLPHLLDRALSIVRAPQGLAGDFFFQKNYTDSLPDDLHPVPIDDGYGIGLDGSPGLVALAQFGVMEIHPWGSRASDLERPDRITFDLDPDAGLGWPDVVRAANNVRAVLERLGLKSWVKTSGGKGLHVCLPLKPDLEWKEVKAFCHGIAIMLERMSPKDYTSNMSMAKRGGRVFIDYLRNGRGATSISAYSPRARDGAAVSMPVHWEELSELESAHTFTIGNALHRLKTQRLDPWKEFLEEPQDLRVVVEKLA
ncbi:MAG: DNA ligase D [Fimbriimonadaceae bacterium]|nr:DNA ligase D [Fimbriimonadaceae bacterium]